MKKSLVAILALTAGALVGCGDPAPSTPLAPEQKMPDTSKMTPEQIDQLHKDASAGGSDRGQTPADRGG